MEWTKEELDTKVLVDCCDECGCLEGLHFQNGCTKCGCKIKIWEGDL